MPTVIRFLFNPKLFARFMRTGAGRKMARKTAWKYGTMLLNSKTTQDAIKNFFTKNKNSKQFAPYEKKFNELQAKVEKLESKMDMQHATDTEIQTATFTLGRQIIEMQRLYAEMQHQLQQMQLAMMAPQHVH